jgi:hypothetical protein
MSRGSATRYRQQVRLPRRPVFCSIGLNATASEMTAMVPFFVQFKCKLGQSYAVANALAEAERPGQDYTGL